MKEFPFSEIIKLFIPLCLIIILFFTVIFLIILPYSKDYLIRLENEKIKQLVDSELQILESLDNDIKTGKLSSEEARSLAVELLREQRHGNNHQFYFWILDTNQILIMHPFRPELENTFVGDYIDPEGNRLFHDMAEIVKKDSSGYIEYQWQLLDDPTNIADKKSYVEGFSPWDWIIGTGFYKEVTFHEINRLFLLITIISIAVMVIILIVSAIIIKQRFDIRKKNKYFARSLMESEKRYKILIDSMNEGFLVQDQNGILQLVNKQICAMLGYSEEKLLGSRPIDLIPEENREFFKENMKKRRSGIDSPYEIVMRNTNGNDVPVIVSPRGIFSESGEYQGSFATITDISSLKQIEKELSRSLDEKDILIKELHHRVKNNLQILISLLNMQSSDVKKPILSKIVKDFEARVYSMALVHEILYESENLKFINLNEYINRLVSDQVSINPTWFEHLKLNINISNIFAPIDKAINYGLIINELFSNSMNHAYKKSKEEKRINISIEEKNTGMLILFSDDGTGIDESESENEKNHIGLKLISLLIEQMEGTLEIKTSPSEGSRFIIRSLS